MGNIFSHKKQLNRFPSQLSNSDVPEVSQDTPSSQTENDRSTAEEISENPEIAPSTSTENEVNGEVTSKELFRISLKITVEERRSLARALNLSVEEMKEIEHISQLNEYHEQEITYEVLEKWKIKNGKKATKRILKDALIEVGREDILDKVFTIQPQNSEQEGMKMKNKDEVITPKVFLRISLRLSAEQRKHMLRKLNLSTEKIIKLKLDNPSKEFDEITYEHLEDWITANKNEASRNAIENALLDAGRKHIVDKLYAEIINPLQTSHVEEPEAQSRTNEVPSTSDESASVETPVTSEEITNISRMILRNQCPCLARELKLTEQKYLDIDHNCNVRNLKGEEVVIQILQEWIRNNGIAATKGILKNALISIGRKDIADKVLSSQSEYVDIENMKMHYEGIRKRLEEKQRTVYNKIQLNKELWMDGFFPLENLYVDLELVKIVSDYKVNSGTPILVEQLFDKIDEKDPVRILIEGGPGYGKTTLCLKLLHDWKQNKNYIGSKFKLVFLFELRYFKESDSLEEIFKRECDTVDVNGDDGINCIKAFENEILLILDGFDEMNEECKRKFIPLIQKKLHPSMFIVVTSRSRMFQVEEKEDSRHVGLLQQNATINAIDVWSKRILIKGVTPDKIEIFLSKYLENDYKKLVEKINSITKGEMRELFECPLFLILLGMMLEKNTIQNIKSKTCLYIEFFHFILRRYLIRKNMLSKNEILDIFHPTGECIVITSLIKFGQLAIGYLCKNKLMFHEMEILNSCKDELILQLGFLIKIQKLQGHQRDNFYQPIHKSFLEFVAAYAMWNLFKTNEHQFKREIERIGDEGLKPTNDSMFYVFLGGFLNSEAYVLFQSLRRYALWFNIENLCFTNILLEINDINSFFPSFQPSLDSFIPSIYRISGIKGVKKDFFQSTIHSRILKYSSDQKLIHVLQWNPIFSINFSHELYFHCLKLYLTNEIYDISSNQNINMIKCKNLICHFSEYIDKKKWRIFVSLFNSIKNETINFFFDSDMNDTMLPFLYKELTKGQWKGKNIDRVRFHLNAFDDPNSIGRLVKLVKKNRINEGINLWIKESDKRSSEMKCCIQETVEKLVNAFMKSSIIKDFTLSNFFPPCHDSRVSNSHLKTFNFIGSLTLYNSNEKKRGIYSFEEVNINLSDDQTNLDFIQRIHDIKYLACKGEHFDSLVEIDWSGLNEIEELYLIDINTKTFHSLNVVSKLTNLQVLSLDVRNIETVHSSYSDAEHLFSSLNLRICEFLYIRELESFSFFVETVMKGLNIKANDENNSTVDSNEGKNIQLQELVIGFDQIEIDFNQLNECNGIRYIKRMLRHKQLQQCCWINFCNIIKSDQSESLFSSKDKFRIVYEVNGMNPTSSRLNQFDYRWFTFLNRFCIKFADE